MTEIISNAYDLLDRMQISPVGIVIAMIVLALAFLFAVREAAAWFFKIDDIKSDLHRLQDMTGQLESEIRTLQALLAQANGPLLEPLLKTQAVAVVPSIQVSQPQQTEPAPAQTTTAPTATQEVAKSAPKPTGSFPIHH